MEPRKHYLAVGLFVIGAFTLLALFSIWVTKGADDRSFTEYRIYFSESVTGLSKGGAVKFRGVEIGRVLSIDLDKTNSERVEVHVNIDSAAPIKPNTVATLKSQGITGITFVELSQATLPISPIINYADGVPEIPSEPSNITLIVTSLPEMMERFSKASEQFAKLLNDENIQSTGNLMKNLSSLTGSLESNGDDLGKLLKNTVAAIADLKAFMGKTNRFADSGYDELNQTLTEIKNTTRNANELTQKLKDNPSQILFPSKQEGVRVP
jgi:phospholipid/cholesterol/gamma-HCH transport system substrate-binding protein